MKQLRGEKKPVCTQQLTAPPEFTEGCVLEHKPSSIPGADTQPHNPAHLENLGRIQKGHE